MAQAEDTELRDLVIDALEKNGSLAKIRALLRANVFLAFENECENIKQNVSLDNILMLPEGILALSIVHEFLEFCNLKNTLFVYMAESRQRKEYVYEGRKMLAEKLVFSNKDNIKEPVLISLLKNVSKHIKFHDKGGDNNYKDDQNCTYIVHEDASSTTSNSQSDNSSDERNKLHLRLQLDNSDTDTSSDSARDKSSSEYIPNQHIAVNAESTRNVIGNHILQLPRLREDVQNDKHFNKDRGNRNKLHYLHDLKVTSNSSSDSTSYVDLKPYNSADEKLMNTAGLPCVQEHETETAITQSTLHTEIHQQQLKSVNVDPISPAASKSSVSSVSKNEDETRKPTKSMTKSSTEESQKSEAETADYSYDFTSSPITRNKEVTDKVPGSPESIQEQFVIKSPNTNSSIESQHNSQSSQSSVSISDVADLISEKSASFEQHLNHEGVLTNNDKSKPSLSTPNQNSNANKVSDDSGDFTESPVPSLSNLSLDVHSD